MNRQSIRSKSVPRKFSTSSEFCRREGRILPSCGIAFEDYIRKSAALAHYVLVMQRTGPLRRMNEGQNSDAPSMAKSKFVWSTEKGWWDIPNGVSMVVEEEP